MCIFKFMLDFYEASFRITLIIQLFFAVCFDECRHNSDPRFFEEIESRQIVSKVSPLVKKLSNIKQFDSIFNIP